MMIQNQQYHLARGSIPADENQARARLLYSQSMVTFFFPILAASAICTLLWSVAPRERLLGWTLITTFYSISRYALLLRFRSRQAQHDVDWLNLLAVSVFLSGALWGMAPVILLPYDPVRLVEFTLYTGLVFLVICGLVAGAVVAYSWSMRVMVLYVVPALLPGALHLIALGDRYNSALGGFVLLYMVFIFAAATRMHVQLRRYMEIEQRMEALRSELDLLRRRGDIPN